MGLRRQQSDVLECAVWAGPGQAVLYLHLLAHIREGPGYGIS